MHIWWRLLIVILISLAVKETAGQTLTGVIIDKSTRLPIANAGVTLGNIKTYSLYSGHFKLNRVHTGDTIRVIHAGFKPYQFILQLPYKPDTIKIMLEPVSTLLNEVKVRARRDIKSDSIRNREMFASVFNHHTAGIKDVMINNAVTKYVPYNYVNAPNSTTTLVSVNLLQVFGLLSAKKAKLTNLQKTLIADEQYTYAEQRFSKLKVNAITGLKGDSLQHFTDKYRPSAAEIKKMTDYDILSYIKKCYAEFAPMHSK